MEGFKFKKSLPVSDLDYYNGNHKYAIIYETIYLPNAAGKKVPYIYSGSSWRNDKEYLGSCMHKEYQHIWKEETRTHPERFLKKVLAVFDKTKITPKQLRHFESEYQILHDHANDERYFNGTNYNGPGMTSEYCLRLRQQDPEEWKRKDIESAAKAANTKRNWSSARKKAFSEKMSNSLKGRKNPWNAKNRAKRPKCIYFMSYKFITPTGEVKIINEWENMRQYLAEYNKDKHRDKKCGLERLIKEKEWRGFKIIELRRVFTEGKEPEIIYVFESTGLR